MRTRRNPQEVMRDVDVEWFPDNERYLRALLDALEEEGWLRSPGERLDAALKASDAAD